MCALGRIRRPRRSARPTDRPQLTYMSDTDARAERHLEQPADFPEGIHQVFERCERDEFEQLHRAGEIDDVRHQAGRRSPGRGHRSFAGDSVRDPAGAYAPAAGHDRRARPPAPARAAAPPARADRRGRRGQRRASVRAAAHRALRAAGAARGEPRPGRRRRSRRSCCT